MELCSLPATYLGPNYGGGNKDKLWWRYEDLQDPLESENESEVAQSDSFRPHGLQPTRLLCPWDFPGNSTRVDCHFLLGGIFLTQRLNLGLLHCRQMFYHLSHQGSPNFLVLSPPKDVLFIIRDWNTKVGSQETPGVTGKFGLGVRNEAGQRLIEFC